MAENKNPVPDGITSTDEVVVVGEPGVWIAKARGGGFKRSERPEHRPEDGEPPLNAHVASGDAPSTPEEVREAEAPAQEGNSA